MYGMFSIIASFLVVLFCFATKLNVASALHQLLCVTKLAGISYSTTEWNSLMSRCGLSFESQRMAVRTVE